jgi:hypothetical protein
MKPASAALEQQETSALHPQPFLQQPQGEAIIEEASFIEP